MKKKYLKTVEDVLALKNTDTKIYRDGVDGYYQFVKDILVEFSPYNAEFWRLYPSFDIGDEPYILEEEPMQEVTEKDIGKLCWFYTEDDTKEDERDIGILTGMPYEKGDSRHYEMDNTYYYEHCRRLSPAEVAEITGYGVSEDGSTFYGEPFKVVGKVK